MSEAEHEVGYAELAERLGLHFAQPALLEQALTHRSYSADFGGAPSNERLEFLGDAVLDLLIGEELYRRHPDWPEGELTKARATVVDAHALAQVARHWELGNYLRLSHAAAQSGDRERRSLLADAVEAIIGAYYLDRGLDATREFLQRAMADLLDAVQRREHERDYKTQLQELLQARFHEGPNYEVVVASGPDHNRTFTVAVVFSGEELGRGEGKSKKEAEQHAAARALENPFISQL